MRATTTWLSLSVGAILSACGTPGDFCTVVLAPITFAPETAAVIVETDRPSAEAIRVQNDYWTSVCD